MGVLAGGGVGVEAAARGGRRRAEVGGDHAEAAAGGVHWGLLLLLTLLRRHGSRAVRGCVGRTARPKRRTVFWRAAAGELSSS